MKYTGAGEIIFSLLDDLILFENVLKNDIKKTKKEDINLLLESHRFHIESIITNHLQKFKNQMESDASQLVKEIEHLK